MSIIVWRPFVIPIPVQVNASRVGTITIMTILGRLAPAFINVWQNQDLSVGEKMLCTAQYSWIHIRSTAESLQHVYANLNADQFPSVFTKEYSIADGLRSS